MLDEGWDRASKRSAAEEVVRRVVMLAARGLQWAQGQLSSWDKPSRVVKAGNRWEAILKIERKDYAQGKSGKVRTAHKRHATPIRDDNGQAIQGAFALPDILKKTPQEVEETRNMLRAHENEMSVQRILYDLAWDVCQRQPTAKTVQEAFVLDGMDPQAPVWRFRA